MSRQRKTYVDFKVDDGSPVDRNERRQYIASVIGFYSLGFKNKLEHMISQQRAILDNPENSRETDLFIKANINAMSLMLDWGDECMAEHQGYIEEDRQNGLPQGGP